MKLAIFGASGGTGTQLLGQALDAGHEVTVIARDPTRVPIREHNRLAVVNGDVLDPAPWRAAVSGHDAVLSCLGSTDRRRATSVYSRGTANIVEAMDAAGMRRLVCLSSVGLEIPPSTPLPQRLVTRLIIQRMYRRPYADMAEMERLVKATTIDWTIIRAPMLADGPVTGGYRTAINTHLTDGRSIARADLAHFMLNHLDNPQTWKAVVEISR